MNILDYAIEQQDKRDVVRERLRLALSEVDLSATQHKQLDAALKRWGVL